MAKIGVFDSGLGGLTVLKELVARFPNEYFLYLGDTARLPYGTKSPGTIRKYSEQIMDFLSSRQVDALVIACNSASSQVPEKVWRNLPVFNVIEPGAERAVGLSAGKRIGLLGTRATVTSGSYQREIQKLDSSVQVFAQACPLFVPLAEEGWIEDPITNLIAYRYLQPLLQENIDTLILGCTHYPLLQTSIQRACGPAVQLVDSGTALATKIEEAFQNQSLIKNAGPGKVEILMTDFSLHTQSLATQVLQPTRIETFEIVQL
jgi:glutamate racemase